MKISLNWLKEYIDINMDPMELGEILTAIGLEVEGIEEVETVPGGLKGLVVGHVVECNKHPGADRLSLTKVNLGDGEPRQIVCGAPNVEQGQKVIVATLGTMLYPTGGDPFKIKKGKIRGEVSEGMICAEDEIGMGTGHDGILVLPDDIKIGSAASEYFDVHTDIVYDIGLTPNRSDATSHLGVARDLAAYLKVNAGHSGDVTIPASTLRTSDKSAFPVTIESTQGCPRFTGVTLSGIKLSESPEWIKRRLTAVGVRPINIVVDITNYVLHMYGQPLHAYDLSKISEGGIIVKTLPLGSTFTTLDEVERKLLPEDVIVCDGNSNGMCIGGVFGGAKSGVTNNTTDIFLEAAHFDAKSIRITSTKHNLRTDAAKCFEKGTDPNGTLAALTYAAFLMQEFANAVVSSKIVDIYPIKIEKKEVAVRKKKITALIGNELESEMVERIFDALHMDISYQDDMIYRVKIPTDKSDVTREADVIEEILRIYGFNNVEIDNKLSTNISTSHYPALHQVRNILADFLVGKGFYEIMGLSLVPSDYYDRNELVSKDNLVFINNTSNVHLDIMRPEMVLSGLESVRYNLNRQQSDIRFFEFGKCYNKSSGGFKEVENLTLYFSGEEEGESWLTARNSASFYTVKKTVQEILTKMGIDNFKSEEHSSEPYEYGMRYFLGDINLVKYGAISKPVLRNMDIKSDVFVADFNLDMLYKKVRKQKISTKEINKFPSMRRDLSLTMDESISFNALKKVVFKSEKKLIKQMNLFDVYKNEKQLGKGKKSYALSFLYEDSEKTLNDKQVDKSMNNIIRALSEELRCEIRG